MACVTCHIGEGGAAFVHAKLAGVRQLAHVISGRYPRPIRQAEMRPALVVCGTCHVPTRDAGDRLRVFREYASDEANTETTTQLHLHVGGAGRPTSSGRAIHWHADPRVRIEYVAADRDRQTIPYVKVTGADGGVREYMADGAAPEQVARGERRQMDCIDCHNVTGHRIWPTAEKAVDSAMAEGRISRQLPFVRREGVAIVSRDYGSQEAGLAAIERDLRQFYRSAGHAVNERTLAQTIAAVRAVYASNVFPAMKVTYGIYPDHAGHVTSPGCFRCHDGGHTARDGSTISADCEYCHKDLSSP